VNCPAEGDQCLSAISAMSGAPSSWSAFTACECSRAAVTSARDQVWSDPSSLWRSKNSQLFVALTVFFELTLFARL
jgi:hypothetical protein